MSSCFLFLLLAGQTAHKYRRTQRALAAQMWGNVFWGGKRLRYRAVTRGCRPGLFEVNLPVNKHRPLQNDNGAYGPFCSGYKKTTRKQVGDLSSEAAVNERNSQGSSLSGSPEGLAPELNVSLRAHVHTWDWWELLYGWHAALQSDIPSRHRSSHGNASACVADYRIASVPLAWLHFKQKRWR